MCGIVGIMTARRREAAADGMRHMVRAVRHRGPDDEGSVIREAGGWTVALGHTRLAILDLSAEGHQPMESGSGSFWLTYNGEIYNFQQLRSELAAEGVAFRSQSDTEVVVKAYERWGAEAIGRFRGMFAFGIWDEAKEQLLLARDPMGIKPLYYYQADGVFVFASEIRALLASGLVPRRVSRDGIASYLRYGSIEAPLTILENVRCLAPGSLLTVTPGPAAGGKLTVSVQPYAHDLFATSGAASITRADAARELQDILAESVRLHLISDVPLGVFLSGGIDSSAVVALASRIAPDALQTFAVTFAEKEFSESSHSAMVARKFGANHREILLTEDRLLSLLPRALQSMDQPSGDGINTFVISQAVKEAGITVALSGLGGDELFAGYSSFRRARAIAPLSRIPRGLRRVAAAAGKFALNGSVQRTKFWDLLASDVSATAAYSISRRVFDGDEIHRLSGCMGTHVLAGPLDMADSINAVSICEMRGYMANTLLRDTDSMSMAHALEVRVPFVDSTVVRAVLDYPGDWKLDPERPKSLLLDAMGDLLPEEIWRRKKMGFTLPFERWMLSALRPEIERLFAGGERIAQAGLDPAPARSVWTAFERNPLKERWSRPWALYVLGRWCELNGVSI
ncbi:MAG: asparagine synthase (glutamine-hydrolyzing) [Bryobacteraceae bacterium]